jgi:hypothetical protein
MKVFYTAVLILVRCVAFGQNPTSTDTTLLALGKAYWQYMSEEVPPVGFTAKQVAAAPDSLKRAAKFIAQTITPHNNLLTNEYLVLPEVRVLRNIYYIKHLGKISDKKSSESNILTENLRTSKTPYNILVDNYYSLLFISIGNKNKPFDMSKYNFALNDYGLKNDTEKGIFFLRCMELCGKQIWGRMNIAKPARTKQALADIQTFPKINGQDYYQYTDFIFSDFPIFLTGSTGAQSYKFYLINKYYDLLISHLICLQQEKSSKAEVSILVSKSIINNRNLFNYSAKKEQLEVILKEQKL